LNSQKPLDAEQSSAAIQHGQLTPEQQQRLAAAIRGESVAGLIGTGFFALLFGLMLIFLWLVGLSVSRTSDWLQVGGLFGLSVTGVVFFSWRRVRRLAEVREGRLLRASGHVAWESGMYRAKVFGRILNVSAFNLSAGIYDFSYLPRSGQVVTVEPAAAVTPAEAKAELRHALAVTNHFNLDDLRTYRLGRLEADARRRLPRIWSTTGWLLLEALISFVPFVVIVTTGVGKVAATIAFLATGISDLVFLGSALFSASRTLDLLRGQVISAQGELHRFKREFTSRYIYTFHFYRLGSQKWLVSQAAYYALMEGQRYRVYYLPRSKLLVGIEPI
jgi:hypothetical protein